MDLTTTRIANARQAIERAGGVGKVAKMLGYANSSFLVQIFGPNPTRSPTEKVVRRLENAMNLRPGSLDLPDANTARTPQAAAVQAPVDAGQLAQVLALVNRLAAEEKVPLSAERMASLAAMGYEDASEHAGQARESRLRQVIQLLR